MRSIGYDTVVEFRNPNWNTKELTDKYNATISKVTAFAKDAHAFGLCPGEIASDLNEKFGWLGCFDCELLYSADEWNDGRMVVTLDGGFLALDTAGARR
jgi:hypothetical protein